MTEDFQKPSEGFNHNMSNNPARKVAEGAMMIALAVVLGLVSFFMPVLGFLASFLWPIPIVLLIKRQGIAWGVLGLVAAAAILAIFMGPIYAVSMVVNMGLIGIWYGCCFRFEFKPGKTLFGGVIVAGISMLLLLLLSSAVTGIGINSVMTEMNTAIDEMVQMYESSGVLDMLAGDMSAAEYAKQIKETTKTLLPSSFIIFAMVMAFVSYLLSGAVLRRFGYDIKRLPRFMNWHLPWISLWGLIIALASYLGSRYLDVPWLLDVSLNLLYIYMPILMVAGLSVVFWLSDRLGSPMLKIMLLIFLFFALPLVFYILLMLGLIDCVADIRQMFAIKVIPQPKNNQGSSNQDNDLDDKETENREGADD